jgi:hypothetical protein
MTTSDEPLFEAPSPRWRIGDRVVVGTTWGDEGGTLPFAKPHQGLPYAQIALDRGDTITIRVGRVRAE